MLPDCVEAPIFASSKFHEEALPAATTDAKGDASFGLNLDKFEPATFQVVFSVEGLEKQGGRRSGALEFRVSEKGGVSVYGLGRFPVTLYYEQWTRLLDQVDQLRSFLEENKSKLKLKGQ